MCSLHRIGEWHDDDLSVSLRRAPTTGSRYQPAALLIELVRNSERYLGSRETRDQGGIAARQANVAKELGCVVVADSSGEGQ